MAQEKITREQVTQEQFTREQVSSLTRLLYREHCKSIPAEDVKQHMEGHASGKKPCSVCATVDEFFKLLAN
jgi:hypothetical protein